MQRSKIQILTLILTVISNSILHTEALLFFPGGAAGMIFAVAIPLDLPKLYNVFLSYNFESNYRVPSMSTDFTKGPTLLHRVRRDGSKCVERVNGGDIGQLYENMWNEKLNGNPVKDECEPIDAPSFEPLITRRRIYQWIEEKLELHGYYGNACLLRVICEHQTSSFSKFNGVLGDVFHVILR